MKNIFSILIFLGVIINGYSQHLNHQGTHHHQRKNIHSMNTHWKFAGGIGVSSYEGDLTIAGNYFRFKEFSPLNLAMQGEALYAFSNYFFAGASIGYIRMNSTRNIYGGFNTQPIPFRSGSFEMFLYSRVNLFAYNEKFRSSKKIIPYGLFGLGFLTLNPRVKIGERWISVRKIHENQATIPPVALIMPLGIGVEYRLNNEIDLIVELTHRTAFTDKLDGFTHKENINYQELGPEGQVYYDTYYNEDWKRRSTRGDLSPVIPNIGDSYMVLMAKIQYSIIPANKNINKLNFRRRR